MTSKCAEEGEEAAKDRLTEVLCLTVCHREFYGCLELLRLTSCWLLEERLGHVRLLCAVCELDFQLTL